MNGMPPREVTIAEFLGPGASSPRAQRGLAHLRGLAPHPAFWLAMDVICRAVLPRYLRAEGHAPAADFLAAQPALPGSRAAIQQFLQVGHPLYMSSLARELANGGPTVWGGEGPLSMAFYRWPPGRRGYAEVCELFREVLEEVAAKCLSG